MLEFHQVHKTYTTPQGPLNVLDNVSLRLAAGQSLALMGESGSGKSTLLHLAAGLDLPDQGTVSFENQNVASLPEPTRARLRREQLGLVFQQFHLVPSLTVIDNLRLQARLAKRDNVAWAAWHGKTLPGAALWWPAAAAGHWPRPGAAPASAACR
mgnify:CR=1 FL=1